MKNFLLHLLPKHHHQIKPSNLVSETHNRLLLLSNPTIHPKHRKNLCHEVHNLLCKLHFLIYGDADTEPNYKACSEAALEFFKPRPNATADSTFSLLLKSFPELEWNTKLLFSQIVTNLMRQPFPNSSFLVAAEYLEQNDMVLIDLLISKLFDFVDDFSYVALLYGAMLKECLKRSKKATEHVLDCRTFMKNLLEHATNPNYVIAALIEDTLELILTRHKQPVARFLEGNCDWFFQEFNSKLIVSSNQLTKQRALKILKEIFTDSQNHSFKIRYLASLENLKMIMNALRQGRLVQKEAFEIFKMFVDNTERPKVVADILTLNRSKLLRFMVEFNPQINGVEEQDRFEKDKQSLIEQISELEDIYSKPPSLAGQQRFFTIDVD